jgi:DNA-binding NarL/FixJ family response regulator
MNPETAISKTILIVDDSVAVRNGLRTLLARERDLTICGEASNGMEAIERARELNPDVIVLDLSMPVLNGLQAAPVLHQLLPAASIILFTSYGSAVSGSAGSITGIDAVISKDEGMSGLLEQIHSLPAHRKPAESDTSKFN